MKVWIINTTLFAGFFTFLTTTDWIAFTGGIVGIIAGIIKILEFLNNKKKYKLESNIIFKDNIELVRTPYFSFIINNNQEKDLSPIVNIIINNC